MKRSQQSKRQARAYKPGAKAALTSSSQKAEASAVGSVPDYVFLPNAHDQSAIVKLRLAPVGGLEVDLLVRNDSKLMPLLRNALVEVYFQAAELRKLRKATKRQLSSAKSAMKRLRQALQHLENVSCDGRDGLRMLLEGPPLNDEKGEREVNDFAGSCWAIRLDLTQRSLALESAIAAETEKSSPAGERQKRLRTLIESLASWWLAGGGKSLAPYVRANRRDGDRAVVHERSGKFLRLATAVFCDVDVFKKSEVESAVTNMHEARLTTKNKNAGILMSGSRSQG